MYEYIVGKITYVNSNYIVLENSFIGYKVFANNIDQYDTNSMHRFYIYTKVTQNNKGNYNFEYYGFKSISEKYFFELLITLNGVGPKTAMLMLKTDLSLLKKLIKSNDVETLQNLPGFTNKLSIMIVNHLGYKLRSESLTKKDDQISDENINKQQDNKNNVIPDIVSSLKALGYKKNDIEVALSYLEANSLLDSDDYDINELISEAIKSIINKDGHSSTKAN